MSELAALKQRLQAWLFEDALPLWWDVGADREVGGFFDLIGLDGAPTPAVRRARVQTRQTYVYAAAGQLGWQGPWRKAMEHGLDFFLTRFERPDGLFRTKVAMDGSPVDETAELYDQAFALFATAMMRQASPERTDLPQIARSLLAKIETNFHHDGVAFREASLAHPFQSNPHMHLFEASLAWSEADADPVWPALADRLAELCLSRFIDAKSGALREFFDDQWAPAPGVDGRIVEPGHQFEWAWLLQRWGVMRGRADACAAARRLFEIGSSFGVDATRGVAVNALLDDFTPHDRNARLWPQTERIKAAVLLGAGETDPVRRQAYLDETEAGLKGLLKYFDTPVAGLWRDKLGVDGRFVQEPAPASSFYHIICAIAELTAAR
ncbi:MAG: AGE family epimerase/isomerase [Caulobacteraceae bacterium]